MMGSFSKFFKKLNFISKLEFIAVLGTPFAYGLFCWYLKKLREKRLRQIKEQEEIFFEDNPMNDAQNTDSNHPDEFDFKSIGNEKFVEEDYEEAIFYYSKAIEICPPKKAKMLALLYQIRAAAFEKIKNYKEVIKDCTRAIDLNCISIEAFHRRAKAYEEINELKKSIEDIMTVCMLEQGKNLLSIQMFDRIVTKFSKMRASEIGIVQNSILPSNHCIKGYFSTFKEDPILNDMAEFEKMELAQAADSTLSGYKRVLYCLSKKRFENVIPACNVEIEQDGLYKARALLAKGTILQLYGKFDSALECFDELFKIQHLDVKTRVNGLIKYADVLAHKQQLNKAFEIFEEAIKLDHNNCDIYYHRGQAYLLMVNLKKALENMSKTSYLNPNDPTILALICWIEFKISVALKYNQLEDKAINDLLKLQKKYPNHPTAFFMHGQIMTEKRNYKKAENSYLKAMSIDPQDAIIKANCSLLYLKWKPDFSEASKYAHAALKEDPNNIYALEVMGTIEVKRGNIRHGLKVLSKAMKMCRSETDLVNIIVLHCSAEAQLKGLLRIGLII